MDINIDCSFKEKEYYEKVKKKFNEKYSLIYRNKFSGRPYVGNCSYLYKILHPTSPEDFFNKYTAYYNDEFSYKNHKGNENFGRSVEQLKYLAKCYYESIIKKDKNSNVTIQDCYDDLVNHIITETYDGHFVERYMVSFILESSDDFIVEPCVGKLDAEIGIDFIIKKHSDPSYVRYMQVKPQSFFFYAKENESLLRDRLNAMRKEKILQDEIDKNGVIEYIIYNKKELDKTGKVLIAEKDKKTKFRLNELINEYGQPKFNIIKDFNYEIPGKQKENDENNQ